jgi:MFS family permease
MFSVSSSSLLFRVTPSELRGRAQGVYAGGFLLGSIAGPALGVVASWSLRAPFFLYAGTLAVAGALGLHGLRHSLLAARQTAAANPMTLSSALRLRNYRAALAATTSAQFSVVGVRSALIPLFVIGPMALHRHWTYVSFFVVSIVSGVLLGPVGRWADRRNRLRLLAVGLVIGSLGLLTLPLSPTIAGLLLASVLLGLAGAVESVVPGALVGDVIGGGARGGTVVSAYQMAGDFGSVLGPLTAGALADRFGYSWSFAVAAAVSLLPLVLLWPAGTRLGTAAQTAAVCEE